MSDETIKFSTPYRCESPELSTTIEMVAGGFILIESDGTRSVFKDLDFVLSAVREIIEGELDG